MPLYLVTDNIVTWVDNWKVRIGPAEGDHEFENPQPIENPQPSIGWERVRDGVGHFNYF